ncbi:hypothetical protein [Streptomyces bobili]|uniref:hypothetical protein n=1 Tax=Streptomyces bobili TaxID=67280 RepID=UPI003724BEE1
MATTVHVSLDSPGERPAYESGDNTVFSCPSHPPATSEAPAPAGLGEVAEILLVAALPEFLGALGAALVITVVAAVGRFLHRRASASQETDGTE